MAPNSSAQKWILLGIPVLIILSFPLHYLYEWSGNSTIVGIFAPVNESVWEHLKLTFWPMLIWWLTGYFIFAGKHTISAASWFTACAAAEIACMLIIVSFYYTYTGALGIESIVLDIFSLILGVILSQILALHIYNNISPSRYCLNNSIIILVLLALAFIVFTFNPPPLPIFTDPSSGRYGI
jgi:hypothetical protein